MSDIKKFAVSLANEAIEDIEFLSVIEVLDEYDLDHDPEEVMELLLQTKVVFNE